MFHTRQNGTFSAQLVRRVFVFGHALIRNTSAPIRTPTSTTGFTRLAWTDESDTWESWVVTRPICGSVTRPDALAAIVGRWAVSRGEAVRQVRDD